MVTNTAAGRMESLFGRYWKWFLPGLAVLLVFAFWPAPPVKPVDTTALVNEAKTALEKDFNEKIKGKNTEIKDLQNRLKVSEQKYAVITKRYTDLKKERENVKPPQTNEELRDRFTALGYPPVPADQLCR